MTGSGNATDQAQKQGVAQLVDTLAVGGAEQLAVRIANSRARRGDSSFIYVLRHDGPLGERVDPAVGVRLLGLHRAPVTNPIAFLWSLLAGRSRLRRQINADKVGVVQSHLPGANFWNLLLAVFGDVGTAPTIHNNQEFSYGASGFKSRLNRLAYRLMLRRCGAVIACSEEVRDSLAAALGVRAADVPRLVAVPNGVDVPEPASSELTACVREAHGLAPAELLVLAAGRLTEQKNFALLIDAVARLRGDFPRLRVIIGGEGELRGDLERQIASLSLQNVVNLPGNLVDLPDLMQAADVFVLSSRFEGLPLVLLEAMAAGLPVVGTRIKGIDEVIESGLSGLICDAADAADLARCLGEFLADPEQRQRCGDNARRRVSEHFSLDRVMRQLDDIYTGINR